MAKKWWILVTLAMLLVLVLITNNQGNFRVGKLISTEKSLPLDFFERPVQQDELVKRVTNQQGYEETWEYFRLEEDIPKVNFSENDVYFVGLTEYGGCPYLINDVQINQSTSELVIDLHLDDELDIPLLPSVINYSCNSIAGPRTFVIEVDKETSKVINHFILVYEENEKVKVIIEN